ncbi:metallophosphoesterase [Cryptosporangium sp. NPDC051539]|uniref:metallophosphoesterase n=1 Tax=Cryptosporangium sp. NPDC051539 TaxID=3363962 RepID=UPI0037A84557
MNVGRILAIVVLVVGVIGGIHLYLWWRMVATPFRSRRARWIGAGATVGIIGFAMMGLRGSPESLPSPLDTIVSWGGPLWIAVMFYLFLFLLALEPVRWIARASIARRGRAVSRAAVAVGPAGGADDAGAEPSDPGPRDDRAAVDRRVFLGRAAALTAGVAALGTVGYGISEARHVRVKRMTITLPRLDPSMNGYRFALLTDIHLSPTLRRPFLDRVVRTVNSLDVGAVAVVGDLVDGSVAELGEDAKALSDLRSADGTFFVTGNHEYYSGAAEWVEYLPTIGVDVLRNRRLQIGGADGFDLAGVDDVTAADSGVPGHGANLSEALDGRDRDRPVVLLAHQPVQWPEAVDRGVDLQLSGHTHGGQMWPFTLAVPLQQPVVAGHATDGDSQIYVSRGVGYWGPPVRVGAPPEISLIELRSPV